MTEYMCGLTEDFADTEKHLQYFIIALAQFKCANFDIKSQPDLQNSNL